MLRELLLGSKGLPTQKWGNEDPVNNTVCGKDPTLENLHVGIDYDRTAEGTPVFSATPGVVRRIDAGTPSDLSTLVIFHEATQTSFIYLHLETMDPSLEEGKPVTVGQELGTVGARGDVTGPHLHFEARNVNSEPFVGPKISGALCIDGTINNPFRAVMTALGFPVDIYFLVDLSGSFFDDLPRFKAQAPDIISTLIASNPNTRFGLGKFEDYPIFPFGSASAGDKAYEQLLDLTFNTNLVLNTIAGLFTRSGGDGPQSQLPALFQAATGAGQDLSVFGFPGATIPAGQQANFRNGATKLFLLWTDAPFHNPGEPGDIPYPGPSFSQTVDAILALDPPKVIGISSGTFGVPDLEAIAEATDSLAPPGGVDCDGDGTTDIPEGDPLVCSIAPSGEGIGEAVIAIVGAATGIEVDIDIKPGTDPNSINLGSHGVVPVAILSSETFDATTVDPLSVTFAGAGVKVKGQGTTMMSFEDVNGDGRTDMVVQVSTEALALVETDTEAILQGETLDGIAIRGTDSVRIVP